jgi:hypothetical protein
MQKQSRSVAISVENTRFCRNQFYYREKSIREVAVIVGVPEPTVKTRMFYARRRIAELMREHGTSQGQLADYKAA